MNQKIENRIKTKLNGTIELSLEAAFVQKYFQVKIRNYFCTASQTSNYYYSSSSSSLRTCVAIGYSNIGSLIDWLIDWFNYCSFYCTS